MGAMCPPLFGKDVQFVEKEIEKAKQSGDLEYLKVCEDKLKELNANE